MEREPTTEEVKQQAREYANRKWDENQAVSSRKEQGTEVLEAMKTVGLKKVKIDFDTDTDATVSIKERENTTVDEDRLRKAVGARTWNKLTTAVLDPAKVEAAIKLGELDPNVLSSCMESKTTEYLEARFAKKRGKR